MTSGLTAMVLLAPGAFVLTAAVAAAKPGTGPDAVKRVGTIATWAGVVVAAFAGASVASRGDSTSGLLGGRGLGFSVRLDSLSTVMLAMISLLAVVIFRYSCTYLDGDDRHGAFLGRLAVAIAAVEALVVAGNLAMLVVAWIATSLALHRLLLFYPERRAAVVAARKKFIAARLGDFFLIGAAGLLYHRFGTGDLGRLFDLAPAAARGGWSLGAVEAAALGIAIAAVLKSAQFPTHGWLVEVMETPTPVSALLHAGILNAGPFLILRLAFIVDGSATATAVLVAVGGFTALFASVVLLTQPSVKVALGYSSAAHMGFMLLVCGMGVYPAVLLHLVAHSFYKAHAFLSSGSVIDETRASAVAVPSRLGSPSRLAASAALAVGIYLAMAALWQVDFTTQPMLLAIGAVLVLGTTQIVAPTLDSDGPASAIVRAAGLATMVTVAFFSLEGGAHHLLGEAVPHHGARTLVHAALVTTVVAGFATVIIFQLSHPALGGGPRRRRLALHLRNGLYANAAFDRTIGALRVTGQSS